MIEEYLSRFNVVFHDLYTQEGVVTLDKEFLKWLSQEDMPLIKRLQDARGHPEDLSPKQESALLVDLAPAG